MSMSIGSVQSGFSMFDLANYSTSKLSGSDFEEIASAAGESSPSDKASNESSETSETEKTYDPADFNRDGIVSAQEALAYLQMQLADNMAAEMGAESNMDFQSQQQESGNFTNLEEFKKKKASGIYNLIQNALMSSPNAPLINASA